jgi:hypothetical protein
MISRVSLLSGVLLAPGPVLLEPSASAAAPESFLQTAPEHSKPGQDENAYHQTSGIVQHVRPDRLLLKEYDGSALVLRLEPDTRVLTPSGALLPVSRLNPGAHVRVSYLRVGGQDRAVRINVLEKGQPKSRTHQVMLSVPGHPRGQGG